MIRGVVIDGLEPDTQDLSSNPSQEEKNIFLLQLAGRHFDDSAM